jgi:hypothetical protein
VQVAFCRVLWAYAAAAVLMLQQSQRLLDVSTWQRAWDSKARGGDDCDGRESVCDDVTC